MEVKYNNNNLTKTVLIAFEMLNIKPPISEPIDKLYVTLDNNYLRLDIAEKGKNNYFYIKLNFASNVTIKPDSKNSYELNDGGENYVLWGYVDSSLTEFIVDDFTFIHSTNGKSNSSNYFRDVINSKEAQVYTQKFLTRIQEVN